MALGIATLIIIINRVEEFSITKKGFKITFK